ncbi:MAG: porin family protein [Rhizobiales bacterium]|nr:porin family protein [Hyphomicrobiales bacterium]
MSSLLRIVFAAALTTTLATNGQAADAPSMAPLPPIIQAPPSPVIEFTSGWYLRGDIGYRFNNLGTVTALIGPNPTNNTIDDGILLGVGGGYKSGWFRADVTLDHGGQITYEGTRSLPNDYKAKVDSYTVLFNVYFDLGTWSGFTPYIGGGIGGSFLRGRDFARVNTTIPRDGFERWNLGWAWMAGVSSAISPSVVIDVGYRYIDLGDATTNFDSTNNQLFLNNLTAHEVRIGARYLFD